MECLRNNGGIWYTHLALEAYSYLLWNIRNDFCIDKFNLIYNQIYILEKWCRDPNTYKYKRFNGLLGKIQEFVLNSFNTTDANIVDKKWLENQIHLYSL